MQRTTQAAALVAILAMPVVTYSGFARHAQASAQPAAYTYQGTVRSVNPKTGSLELVTGVGMALRLVQMTVAAAPASATGNSGAALRLTAVKPGDVVRAHCRLTPTGLVADKIEKVEVHTP